MFDQREPGVTNGGVSRIGNQSARGRFRCSLDGGENLVTRRSVEFVAVEAKEHAFPNLCLRSLRVLFPQGRFHQCTSRVAHGAPMISRSSPVRCMSIARYRSSTSGGVSFMIESRDTERSTPDDPPIASCTYSQASSQT